MHREVPGTQLVYRPNVRHHLDVLRAEGRALGVHRLRTGDDYLSNRKLVVTDDFEHLRCAEAVDQDVLCHFWHVAAVCCLVPDHVDVRECSFHRLVVLDVALHKLGFRVDPGRLAELVRVGLQVGEDADRPSLREQQVDNVGTDKAGAAGDKSTLLVSHRRMVASRYADVQRQSTG